MNNWLVERLRWKLVNIFSLKIDSIGLTIGNSVRLVLL
jgi:hypothetical protein